MFLMLEEIVVEIVAIAAPLVALGLIYLIGLTILERRELRRLESARRSEWASERSAQRHRRADASPLATSPTVRAQT